MSLRSAVKRGIARDSIRHDLRGVAASLSTLFHGIRAEIFGSRPPLATGPGLKVNIGCGPIVAPGWINMDQEAAEGAYYANVLNGLPFADRSVARIHCEHFLEHLEFEHARLFLRECWRTLEDGGTLRIIVPDAGRYCEAYVRGDTEFFSKLETLGGAAKPLTTPMQVINQMFRMGGAHRFAWDFETLREAVLASGFSDIERSSKADAALGDIDGSDWWREIESLYVNATR